MITACALGAAPSNGVAQWSDILALEAGDSLRLRLPGALRVEASMREMRQDTLILAVAGLSTPWPVSGFDLVSLERYGDRSPRQGLRNGAVLGMVIGIFAGAALGASSHIIGSDGEGEASAAVLNRSLNWAGGGALVGAVGGAVMGSRRPGRGWLALDLPTR